MLAATAGATMSNRRSLDDLDDHPTEMRLPRGTPDAVDHALSILVKLIAIQISGLDPVAGAGVAETHRTAVDGCRSR